MRAPAFASITLALLFSVACQPQRTTDEPCTGDDCEMIEDPQPDLAVSECVAESDEELCADRDADCGKLSIKDKCGKSRQPNCGSCISSLSCGGGGTPNQCGCTPQDDESFCASYGKTCGTYKANDNCGKKRTASCGTCSGGDVCTDYVCGCAAETDAELCTTAGRACGSLTTTDRCGGTRTISSCGSCTSSSTCNDGVCSCSETESTFWFCARNGNAVCGALSGTDLCGNPKSVTSCGICYAPQTCGGAGIANHCGCPPETDAEFCARKGFNCGEAYALDNCGAYHDCGECTLPETCGAITPNVCACKAETNTTFCARLGKNCGSVAAADNCGTMRTVSCGTTCGAGTTCGGGGMPNVCGCSTETDAQLCAKYGASCGALVVTDSCAVIRTLDCGGCTSGKACGANGVANVCGTPFVISASSTSLHAVSVSPIFIDSSFEAFHAVSPTEYWIAGQGVIVRVKDGAAQPYYIDGFVRGARAQFWSSSPSDVWLASYQTLLRWNGTAWSKINAGFAAGSTFTAIHGSASNDVFVASSTPAIRRWDGATWTTFALPSATGEIRDIYVVATGTPLVSRGVDLFKWNGLSYVPLPDTPLADVSWSQKFWVAPNGTIYVLLTYQNSSLLYRLDNSGTTWTSLDGANSGAWLSASKPYHSTIKGYGDNNLWYSNMPGNSRRFTTGVQTPDMTGMFVAPTSATTGFTADYQRVYEWTNNKSIARFDATPSADCTTTYADSSGGAWLLCGTRTARVDSNGVFKLTTTDTDVATIASSPSTSLWVVRSTGAIEKRATNGTVTHNNWLGSKVVGISATTDSNVWIATKDGGAGRWNGTSWTTSIVPITASQSLTGIIATPTTAYAYGATVLYQWNGSAWTSIALPASPSTYLPRTISQVVVQDETLWVFTSATKYLTTNDTITQYSLYYRNGSTLSSASGGDDGSLRFFPSSAGLTSVDWLGNIKRWTMAGATTIATLKDVVTPLQGAAGISGNGLVFTYMGRTFFARY